MLEGVDVSNYQGQVNWAEVAGSGRTFAAAKATEGTWYTDPTFQGNWQRMARHGVNRIAYHFLRPEVDGRSQCDFLHHFVYVNGRFVQGDAVMLDLEVTDGKDPQHVLQCARDFVEHAKLTIWKQVILYTYPDFWIRQLGNPKDDVLAQCPLWIASYADTFPQLANWPVTSFWQYTSEGQVPGIEGQTDCDKFLGTMQQYRTLMQWPPRS